MDGRGCGRPSAGKRRRGAALLPLRHAAGVLERPFRESLRQVRALVCHLRVTRSVPYRLANIIILWSVTRLNGCYEALEGGNTTEALIDFTGGVSEPLSLDREALRLRGDERRALFQTLAKAHERKALITCSIRVRFFSIPEPSSENVKVVLTSQPAEGETVESVLDCGLVRGHAYGVTAVKKVWLGDRLVQKEGVARFFMVRMRNPWGTADWTGAWSQG